MIHRPTYVDTHAHLDDEQFDHDRDAVINEAVAAGVSTIINIGYSPERWTSTLALAERRPEIAYTLGLHPGRADEGSETVMEQLESLLVEHRPVAIGEIGLDYYWTQDNRTTQIRWFKHQIDLALRHDLPIVIHQRKAADDVAAILSAASRDLRVVFHSFDGSPILARLAEERRWLLGAGGLMTRRQSEDLRNHLAAIDLGRVVLETDSPYLVPAGVKSRRNTPAAIPLIAERFAGLTGRTVDEIAATTTANARSFFSLLAEAAA